MYRSAVFALSLLVSAAAFAQGARSPEALANQLQAMIGRNDVAHLEKLVYPGADPQSLQHLKTSLGSFAGAPKLQVYFVPKDDAAAVKKVQAATSGAASLMPLSQRVKMMAEKGWSFPLEPLGDLFVTGKKNGGASGIVYGRHKGAYFLMLARKR
ncbi:MAG TPA: hypothetical protein VF824_18110 [Thermoanaerobaculia bacterium]|jgi:hypothetical protein